MFDKPAPPGDTCGEKTCGENTCGEKCLSFGTVCKNCLKADTDLKVLAQLKGRAMPTIYEKGNAQNI